MSYFKIETNQARRIVKEWADKLLAENYEDFDGELIVRAYYDGSSDSGCIEEVSAVTGKNQPVRLKECEISIPCVEDRWNQDLKRWSKTEPQEKVLSLNEVFMDLAYDHLEYNYGGWEINEGSFGDVIFHFTGGGGLLVKIEHNYRIETTEYEERQDVW